MALETPNAIRQSNLQRASEITSDGSIRIRDNITDTEAASGPGPCGEPSNVEPLPYHNLFFWKKVHARPAALNKVHVLVGVHAYCDSGRYAGKTCNSLSSSKLLTHWTRCDPVLAAYLRPAISASLESPPRVLAHGGGGTSTVNHQLKVVRPSTFPNPFRDTQRCGWPWRLLGLVFRYAPATSETSN